MLEHFSCEHDPWGQKPRFGKEGKKDTTSNCTNSCSSHSMFHSIFQKLYLHHLHLEFSTHCDMKMHPIPTQFATHRNSKVDKIVCLCHHPCLQRHLLRNKWRPAGINWNLRIKLASAILKQHLEKLDLLLQCRMCKEPLDSQGICYNATAKDPILEIKLLPANL